ncbi:MAG: tetratricopeptide repeat protein [Aureliella sp.]
MVALQDKLQQAVALHQSGQRDQAKTLYEEVLSFDANNVDAIHLLGVLDLQAGQLESALTNLERAAMLNPNAVNILTNLGTAQRRLGRTDAALGTYQRAIAINPSHAECYHNMGVALRVSNRLEEAAKFFRKAIELKPGYAEAIRNLTQIEMKAGNWEQAVQSSEEAAQASPSDIAAHLRLAECRMKMKQYGEAIKSFDAVLDQDSRHLTALNGKGLAQKAAGSLEDAKATLEKALEVDSRSFPAICNLGTVLQGLKQFGKAIDRYREALEINPNSAEAHNNLGGALKERGEIEEAKDHCRQALELKPELASAHCNLAAALQLEGEFDQAIELYERAMGLRGDLTEALLGLGSVYAQLGRFSEARKCYSRVLFFHPKHVEAKLYRGIVGLLAEDFDNAYADYEARWELPENKKRIFKVPRWDGGELNGQAVLLHAEQGLGDTLQFIRYAKLAKERGGKVIVECQKALIPMLAQVDYIDQLVPQGSKLPSFSSYCPLLSLPGLFETNNRCVPNDVPYLHADPDLKIDWRERVKALPGLKVGIAWQGNPDFKQDKLRSIPLSFFAPLVEMDGVSAVSLQKGFGTEQIEDLPCKSSLVSFEGVDEQEGAFMDTAAILGHLDLFITSDSAIAHLAGALGIRTWLILPFAPDWRWHLNRDSTAWYPTVRLYRQAKFSDWASVFKAIAIDLRSEVDEAATEEDAAV